MKKIFLLALCFIYGCRTYNQQLVANEYKYDTNNLSKNYSIFELSDYGYGKPKENQIVFPSNKKFYRVKLEKKCSIDSHREYEPVRVVELITVFIPLFAGVPGGFHTGTCNVNGTILSDNETPLKYINSNGKDTEVVALYYGYSANDAYNKARDIAFYNARNNLYKQLETISIDEISNLNKEDNAKVEKEKLEKKKKQQQINAANKKKTEAKRKKLVEKYGERTADAIMKQEIFRGMSESALVESWGKPREINSSVGSWGTHKQYVYWDDYVYVENGIVESWQTSR